MYCPKCIFPKFIFPKCIFWKCIFSSEFSKVNFPKVNCPKCIFPKYIFPKCIFPKCIFPKCIFSKCVPLKFIFPKCIYPKCIFAKCTPLACFLCFASLLKGRLGCRIWLVTARDVAPRGQISCSAAMWRISKLHCGAHQMSFQTKSKPGFLPRGLFRGNIFMTRLLRGKCAAAGFSGTMWRYRRWCISKGFDARGREREEAGVREFYNKSNSNDVKDEFWCCWVCLVSLL